MCQPDTSRKAPPRTQAGLRSRDPFSAKAREYQNAALKALGNGHNGLSAASENEILGSQFEDLVNQPDGEDKHQRGWYLMEACQRLFARDQHPAYKWNALEVACRTPLSKEVQYGLLHELRRSWAARQ